MTLSNIYNRESIFPNTGTPTHIDSVPIEKKFSHEGSELISQVIDRNELFTKIKRYDDWIIRIYHDQQESKKIVYVK